MSGSIEVSRFLVWPARRRFAESLPARTQPLGVKPAKFPRPVPDRLVGYRHAPLSLDFFHIPVTQAKVEMLPNAMADYFGREAMAVVERFRSVHARHHKPTRLT